MKKMLKDVKNDPELSNLYEELNKFEFDIKDEFVLDSYILYDAWNEGDNGEMVEYTVNNLNKVVKRLPIIFRKLLDLRNKIEDYSNRVSE